MMYDTIVQKIDQGLLEDQAIHLLESSTTIELAARILKQGELVAFPTETVYGLGADATNGLAVKKIFRAKGRPQDNPLIVHISRLEQLAQIISGELPLLAQDLISAFWPGPLTVIFNKSDYISRVTSAGLDSVAVRMPSHPVARALITASDLPLAGPSANLSGLPSPTTAAHVLADMQGKIPLIIDGGSAWIGVESTVVDVRGEIPVILRPGGLSREELEGVLGREIKVSEGVVDSEEKPLSPGMKYRHYAPGTPLKLYQFNNNEINNNNLGEIIKEYKGKQIALMLTAETVQEIGELPADIQVINMGSRLQPEKIAAGIFANLRGLDQLGLDLIIVEAIPERGIGAAVMNRLSRASEKE